MLSASSIHSSRSSIYLKNGINKKKKNENEDPSSVKTANFKYFCDTQMLSKTFTKNSKNMSDIRAEYFSYLIRITTFHYKAFVAKTSVFHLWHCIHETTALHLCKQQHLLLPNNLGISSGTPYWAGEALQARNHFNFCSWQCLKTNIIYCEKLKRRRPSRANWFCI